MEENRTRPQTRRRTALAPSLESLEGRKLLTAAGAGRARVVEYTSNGVASMSIIGSSRADNIQIADNGTAGAGNITVTLSDGSIYTSKQAVAQISVTGNRGNDHVNYTLTGNLITKRSLAVSLAAGNDIFEAHIDHAVQTTDVLDLEISGGAGNDQLAVSQQGAVTGGTVFPYLRGDAGNDVLMYGGTGTIGSAATVGPALVGGDGNDSITLGYAGIDMGQFLYNLSVDGGNGNDNIAVDVGLAAGSTGKVGKDSTSPALVQGDAGDDHIHYVITVDPTATQAQVNAQVISGDGSDTVLRSGNVKGDTSNENDAIST